MLTRRSFVGRSLAGAIAAGIEPSSSPFAQATAKRMRLEEFVKDPMRVEALKRGVRVMKSRDPSDPTSWFFQAAMHAVRDDWVQAAEKRDPKVAQVDKAKFWNKCPHFGQSSANFLVWHRAYLYYFERILQSAAGDPTLRVPYWNYTDTSQRRFPILFARPEPDRVTQQPTNPLYEVRRELAFAFQLYELSENAIAAPMDTKEFFGATESEGFAGGIGDANENTKGKVELSPHDMIHFAIGGQIGFGTSDDPGSAQDATIGLMSSVPTAAFDPIFWVHHCNIDRLWSVWECQAGRTWGSSPPAGWFSEKPWWFFDANGTEENRERAHYMNAQSLGLAFDSDQSGCQPLSSSQLVASATFRNSPLIRVVRTQEILRAGPAVRLSAVSPVAKTLSLKDKSVFWGKSFRSAVTDRSADRSRRIYIELADITAKGAPSVRYDVYINPPINSQAKRSHESYVGTLALFGVDANHSGHSRAVSQRFDITRLAMTSKFDATQLKVVVVPVELLKPLSDAPRLQRNGDVTIGHIKVITVEGKQE